MLGLTGAAHAAPSAPRPEPPTITVGRAPRLHRDVAWQRHRMIDRSGAAEWTAIHDRDTDVPLRMWGPGQPAPGTMASPERAEAWARAFLAAHLSTLAPGADAADFVVVANQLSPSGDVRSVGFAQRAQGVAVLGGTISFAFKNDRMIMSGSTALPNVSAALPRTVDPPRRLAVGRATSAATAWLASEGRSVVARGVAAEPVIVPTVYARGAGPVDIHYAIAEQVEVEATAGEPGRWHVFVEVETGVAFARQSLLMFESGTVQFDVPVRGPEAAGGRHAQPAGNAFHRINGESATSSADGVVTWSGLSPVSLEPGLVGPLVAVTNLGGLPASELLPLDNGDSVTWSRADDEGADAQLAGFVFASQVKQFVKTRINPGLAYLDRQLSVNVNESPGMCNAYSTGDDIHFFRKTPGACENSSRIADVVYHEFGHSMHRQSIIAGVGQFDGAMSEGVGDTLATALTGDPGVGRGFYLNDHPLRDLDPLVKKVWPTDLTGEVHADGEIYGQAMWKLRRDLQANMGDAAGFERFLKLYYATVQRAVDIPSSFAELLVADDDDGDLANGTPHECAILGAYGSHGLFDPVVTGALTAPVRDGFTVSFQTVAASGARCTVPAVQSAQLVWRPRGGALAAIPLAANGLAFSATIPTQPDGSVVEYSITVTLANGTTHAFPNNNADPYYQFYVGTPTKIWCADFESGAAGWTHTANPLRSDRWEIGAPQGLGGDPTAAFRGTGVLGTALTGDGTYAATSTTAAVSPAIDLHGNTKVHLQYYRWLGVEDGVYDRAAIRANGTEIWRNLANTVAPVSGVAALSYNHIDQEWRFHDLDLTAQAASGQIQLAFSLTSDAAFEAAGWNVDDVCLVAVGPSCGNGVVEADETCDDGNVRAGDGCSPACADELVEGGCCGAAGDPAGPSALAGLVLGAVALRRRQRLPSLR